MLLRTSIFIAQPNNASKPLETRYLNSSEIELAAEFLQNGHVVAFPTETVYGLGANALDSHAVAKIFVAKGRPSDNPLIVHGSSLEMLKRCVANWPKFASQFAETFFPGPLTLVLPKSESIPDNVSAGLDTVAVRIPKNEIARRLIEMAGTPVAAPSANRSGSPSSTTWQSVRDDLDGRIAAVLMSQPTEIGIESTVLDCTQDSPIVLRPGSVSLEQLQQIVPETRILTQFSTAANIVEPPRGSPGLRHRHYQPRARVVLLPFGTDLPPMVNGDRIAWIGKDRPTNLPDDCEAFVCENDEEYARHLYSFFRRVDALNIQIVYCQTVERTGIGTALADRLSRAAQ